MSKIVGLALPVVLVLLFVVSLASGITLLAPVNAEADNAPVYIGRVGPGQTVELQFSRDTGSVAAINPTTGNNALWDKANVVKSTLPEGWEGKDSLKYETPLTVFVSVSPSAEEKNYTFEVGFIDEYEGTESKVAKFTVSVDNDVFDAGLEQETVVAGVGQPAVFALRVKSTSSASETFRINATGLPVDWKLSKTFFLPAKEEKVVYFEVVGNIQKEVPFEIIVSSISSDKITKTNDARIVTVSTLLQDAKATSHGLPLFPSVEQHVYSLIGLVANLLWK